jgi:pimeloyl-ACP methyl ester carboxylesterase
MSRSVVLWLVAAVVVGSATALSAVAYWIPAFIYRPQPLRVHDPAQWGLKGTQEVSFPSGADRLFGWWAPPRTHTSPVVLIVHGRSSNIGTRAQIASSLVKDGFGVLLFDYRGYGQSSGRPSEAGLTEDAQAAYDWLRRQGVASRDVILVGQSLGNAPAAQLSASRPVAALVLVSPFTSLPEAIDDHLGWTAFRRLPWPRNRFDVAGSVAVISAPVLFIVSRRDGLVPYENSLRLARRAHHARWLEVDGLRHEGLLTGVALSGQLSTGLRALAKGG